MKPYITTAFGPTGYRIERWLWNFDAEEYVMDEMHPERFTHHHQPDAHKGCASGAVRQP